MFGAICKLKIYIVRDFVCTEVISSQSYQVEVSYD